MNKQEFTELQDEQGNLLYNFELFNKQCHIIDLKYTVQYFKYLRQQACFQVENSILANAIKLLSGGKTKEEVKDFLDKAKESYTKSIVMLDKKCEFAKVVLEHKKSDKPEDIKDFEAYAKNYFRNYHPGMTIQITKEQNQFFNQVRMYYYDDNIAAFKNAVEMYTAKIPPREFKEEEYTMAASYYYKLRVNINMEMKKQQGGYPFNASHVFDDEMTIAEEEANVRIRLKNIVEANKKLHQDLIHAYGEDVTYIEK